MDSFKELVLTWQGIYTRPGIADKMASEADKVPAVTQGTEEEQIDPNQPRSFMLPRGGQGGPLMQCLS